MIKSCDYRDAGVAVKKALDHINNQTANEHHNDRIDNIHDLQEDEGILEQKLDSVTFYWQI